MPRMTDLLAKCTGQAKRKRDEDLGHFLKRITHLYCAEKGLERIEGLSVCRSLSVLYLYDNLIYTIENLAPCQFLTHLYLQNNNITRIANLSPLPKLSKLYLSYNAITVVEGLEGLKNLSELHIANQRLSEGGQLLFDPRSLLSAAGSLSVLNVSGNNLDSLSDLLCLRELSCFSACDNHLSSMKDISLVFSKWHLLKKLELAGNPLCQKHKYKDKVFTMGTSITSLDGREINKTEKLFLMKWKAMRKARRSKSNTFMGVVPYQDLSLDPQIALTKDFLMSPVHPFTLPALPLRLQPRKNKKPHQRYQNPATTIPLQFSDKLYLDKERKVPAEVRLQASYQNIVADPENLQKDLQSDYLQMAS